MFRNAAVHFRSHLLWVSLMVPLGMTCLLVGTDMNTTHASAPRLRLASSIGPTDGASSVTRHASAPHLRLVTDSPAVDTIEVTSVAIGPLKATLHTIPARAAEAYTTYAPRAIHTIQGTDG